MFWFLFLFLGWRIRGMVPGAHRAGAGQDGHTPLHLAALRGHLEVAEKLLAADAAVGATAKVRDPGFGGFVPRQRC